MSNKEKIRKYIISLILTAMKSQAWNSNEEDKIALIGREDFYSAAICILETLEKENLIVYKERQDI